MIVEDLTLIKTIGKGAFGEVFLTSKSGCAEKFATKKVKKSLVASDKVRKYFNNELFILKQVSHPNIIKLYDIKQTLNNYYLVFDYCNGGGLSNCLDKYKMKHNNKPFPEKIVQHFMRQIIAGIQYIHHKKILHRDIKLDNILVKFDNEADKEAMNFLNSTIKIIDFGFARYLESDSLAQSVLGSPINMDPKILMKLRKIDNNQSFGYDQKADIWSLGTVCYELLIGAPPFDATTYDDLVSKIKQGSYKIPNELKLSKQSISFINAMLQFDHNLRFDIDLLAKHEFLVKDVSTFDQIDLKKASDSKYIQGDNIMLSAKDQLKKSFWNLFDSSSQEFDPTTIPSNMIVENHKNNNIIDDKGIVGTGEDILGNLAEKLDGIAVEVQKKEEVEKNNYVRNGQSEDSIKFEVNADMKNIFNEAFDRINKDFFYIEPMLIPIVPSTDQKFLQLEI